MTVKFTTEAHEDIFEAVEYYDEKEHGLGQRFRDEIAEILITISSAPFLWRERSGKYRRVNCPVFPYYIAYVVRNESIVIIAIAHGSRKPGFWQNQLG